MFPIGQEAWRRWNNGLTPGSDTDETRLAKSNSMPALRRPGDTSYRSAVPDLSGDSAAPTSRSSSRAVLSPSPSGSQADATKRGALGGEGGEEDGGQGEDVSLLSSRLGKGASKDALQDADGHALPLASFGPTSAVRKTFNHPGSAYQEPYGSGYIPNINGLGNCVKWQKSWNVDLPRQLWKSYTDVDGNRLLPCNYRARQSPLGTLDTSRSAADDAGKEVEQYKSKMDPARKKQIRTKLRLYMKAMVAINAMKPKRQEESYTHRHYFY
jgi:hypothetical protein